MSQRVSKAKLHHVYHDFEECEAFRVSSKHKNNPQLKITSRKLPVDFFRPITRETLETEPYPNHRIDMKTPCFGEEKPEAHSVALIPKQKRKLESMSYRIETLPVDFKKSGYRTSTERNHSREVYKKQSHHSYREHNTEQNLAEKSTEKHKLKLQKKLTLNDEIEHSFEKKGSIRENRIRTNIRKFFMQEVDKPPNKVEAHRKWRSGSNKLPPLLETRALF